MKQVSLRGSQTWIHTKWHPLEDEPVFVFSEMLPAVWSTFRSLQLKDMATMILGAELNRMRVLSEFPYQTESGQPGFLFGFVHCGLVRELPGLNRSCGNLHACLGLVPMAKDE